MQRSLPIIAAAALLLSGTAWAQTIVVSPEDEVIIREYMVQQRPTVVEVPPDYVVVGAELPDTVVLTPLDAPGLAVEYEYVAVGDRILLVEPGTRRVIDVLEPE